LLRIATARAALRRIGAEKSGAILAILAILAGLAGLMGDQPAQEINLARVVAGETPGCSIEAKVALVQVASNRRAAKIEGGWFGDADPGPLDRLAVALARRAPDLVDGALYFIGPGDARRMPWLQKRTGRWVCPGTWVEAWR
jgi:hypothetical protein